MKLIAGKLNGDFVNYWFFPESNLKQFYGIGDYAIVENKSGYDLVRIIGIMDTTDEFQHFITNNKCQKVKQVILFISKEDIQIKKESNIC